MMESPGSYGFNFHLYKNVQNYVSVKPDASVFSVCLTGIAMELCISTLSTHGDFKYEFVVEIFVNKFRI
jgi:hypothetical protein